MRWRCTALPSRRLPDGHPPAARRRHRRHQRIADAQPAVRVVVLTTFALDEYVYDALRAGASGFLLKDAPAGLLRHAVHAAARGEAMLSPQIASMLIAPIAAQR